MRYKKKPVIVDAMRFQGNNYEVLDWIKGDGGSAYGLNDRIIVKTLEGEMTADHGDWIIKEPFPTAARKFYPCKPDIFDATYAPVKDRGVTFDGTVDDCDYEEYFFYLTIRVPRNDLSLPPFPENTPVEVTVMKEPKQ